MSLNKRETGGKINMQGVEVAKVDEFKDLGTGEVKKRAGRQS